MGCLAVSRTRSSGGASPLGAGGWSSGSTANPPNQRRSSPSDPLLNSARASAHHAIERDYIKRWQWLTDKRLFTLRVITAEVLALRNSNIADFLVHGTAWLIHEWIYFIVLVAWKRNVVRIYGIIIIAITRLARHARLILSNQMHSFHTKVTCLAKEANVKTEIWYLRKQLTLVVAW